MKTFRTYLESKSIVESSIIRMESQIKRWIKWLEIPVEESSYKNLMNYIGYLQNQDKSINHINRILITISHYYQYKNLPNIALTTRLKGERIKVLSKPIKANQSRRFRINLPGF